MDAFIGTIIAWPMTWAPQGWLPCDGRLLPISGNEALYSLLGGNFGGNWQTNFALPDLRGRVPVGMGQGPGLANVTLGEESTQNACGTGGTAQLGLNYIICVNGIYPSRP
ncbi:MAG: tail fiber protein [Phycisphaerae bacterium]|nr:tail fiber protein [Phycisphaerae bacterium]